MSHLPEKDTPEVYRPVTVPRAVRMIHPGKPSDMIEQSSNDSAQGTETAVKVALKRVNCFYMPVDDGQGLVWPWYESTFMRGGSREHDMYMDKVMDTERKGLKNTFLTDEWVPGQIYEMFCARLETDCIEELYERIVRTGAEVEPLQNLDHKGLTFVFRDPQGHKFQVWQHPNTVTQPMREGVPAIIRAAAIFFPASDPQASYRWYKETLGGPVNEAGQPVTESGEEIYFIKSLEPGKTYNFEAPGNIRHLAFVMFEVNGLDKVHRRMIEQGIKVTYQIWDRGGCGRQFQLYDPDGNKWDIWERQTTVLWREEGAESSDWKQRYLFEDYMGQHLVDDYLKTLSSNRLREAATCVVLMEYNKMRVRDPEGVRHLLAVLDQFCDNTPDRSFQILLREGWYDAPQLIVHREFQ